MADNVLGNRRIGGENKSCRYSVIVTFICQLACIMGCLDSWLNIISQFICESVSVRD